MKKNTLPITILLVFSIALTVVNYVWIRNNLSHIPPPWDSAFYIYMALNNYGSLHDGLMPFVRTVLRQAPNLAPLFPLTAVPFFALFGTDISVAYLTNSVYLFILFVSVFFISGRVAGKKAGWISVFLIATFPAVTAFSRDFLFEFPLAALTAFSYWLFLESESFRKRSASILFGIFAGLAVLTKTMGTVFFVLPFLYAVYVLVRPADSKARQNAMLCIFAAFLVASVFYIPNFKEIFGYLSYYGFGEGSQYYNRGLTDMMSLPYWTLYLRSIAGGGISFGYSVIFLLAFISFLFSKERKISREYLFLWLWFIFGYILLSIPDNKGGERYALPIFAPVAILMAVHLVRLSVRPLKYALISAAVIVGVVNYAYETSSRSCNYEIYSLKGVPLLIPGQIGCRISLELKIPYDRDWDLMPMLRHMDIADSRTREPVRVLLAVDHHLLNICSLKLYAKLGKLTGFIHSDFDVVGVAGIPAAVDAIGKSVDGSDFVITKTGFQGIVFSNKNNDGVKKLLGGRIPSKSFPMSDGSVVSLYGSGMRIHQGR